MPTKEIELFLGTRLGVYEGLDGVYSPGTMRCAVVVPAFMIQIEFCTRLSGSPSDCAVAFSPASRN